MALYTQHYFEMLRIAMMLEPNRSDAEDILQEASKNLWKSFERFDPTQGAFLSWSRGFIRNAALHHRRRYARNRCVLSNEIIAQIADQLPDEEKRLERQRAALERCLESLGPAARDLIQDRYRLKHGDLREFASKLNRSVNAVSTSLSRIRKQLMKCTNQQLREEGGA